MFLPCQSRSLIVIEAEHYEIRLGVEDDFPCQHHFEEPRRSLRCGTEFEFRISAQCNL